MVNKHSSDGIAEDLIRAFVQVGCAESHAKTLLEKVTAELETGITDARQDAILHVDDLIEEINSLAEIRRGMMRSLQVMYPDGDKSYWCMVKHLGVAAYTAFEVYQASDDDADLLNTAMETNKHFVKALSRFLGVEITSCAACFADALKGEDNGI